VFTVRLQKLWTKVTGTNRLRESFPVVAQYFRQTNNKQNNQQRKVNNGICQSSGWPLSLRYDNEVAGETMQTNFATKDSVLAAKSAAGVGTGRNVPAQFRSQPYDCIASASPDQRLTDILNHNSNIVPRDYRQTGSVGGDRRPAWSPGENLCHQATTTASTVNGHCLRDSNSPSLKVHDLRSYQSPADQMMESNSRVGRISRHSGIPVSSKLQFTNTGPFAPYHFSCLSTFIKIRLSAENTVFIVYANCRLPQHNVTSE